MVRRDGLMNALHSTETRAHSHLSKSWATVHKQVRALGQCTKREHGRGQKGSIACRSTRWAAASAGTVFRIARTPWAGRTQACQGSRQGGVEKTADGAANRSDPTWPAQAGCPAGPVAATGPASCGERKCLSELKFFMRCWLGPVLTAGFYPEIINVILGQWAAKSTHKRAFS